MGSREVTGGAYGVVFRLWGGSRGSRNCLLVLASPSGKQLAVVWVCPLNHLEMGRRAGIIAGNAPGAAPALGPGGCSSSPWMAKTQCGSWAQSGHCAMRTSTEHYPPTVDPLQVEL